MEQRYQGPFEIIEEIGRGVYRLANKSGPIKQTVNAINLKLWNEDEKQSKAADVEKQSLGEVDESTENQSSPLHTTKKTEPKVADWITRFNLQKDDQRILRDGEWLNDKHIDAVNRMVCEHIGADNPQSVNISQAKYGFDTVQTEIVLILHDNNHWITTACIGGQLLYMDSLRRPVSLRIQQQMRQLFSTGINRQKQLPVTVVPCARQSNASDCGLYASAFAFEIALHGLSGMKNVVSYDEKRLREHLEVCLEEGVVRAFPSPLAGKRGRK